MSITFIILLAYILFVIIRKERKRKKEGMKMILGDKDKLPCNNRKVIPPDDFGTGMARMKSYRSSNLCNDKVLYPINALDVDYGSKMPGGCPCQQFIQPP